MTKQATICIDIDNTLGNYTQGLRDFIHHTCELTDYECPDPDHYEFDQVLGWPFTGDQRAFHYWHMRAVADGLYKTMQPYRLMPEVIRQLHHNGYHIIISTTRKDDMTKQSERWLYANRIPFDGLHYGDKQDINCDVLIDDNPHTLLAMRAKQSNILLLHPNHLYCRTAPDFSYEKPTDIPQLISTHLGVTQ